MALAIENGFPPVARADASILILGSMPSVASLEKHQYYAHPRNVFWPILEALFDWPTNSSYAARCAGLLDQKIAVWDILHSCQRRGSLDSNIHQQTMQLNDFERFFGQHPGIEKVFFNGQTAERLFKKQREKLAGFMLNYHVLPSTSPAHATMPFEAKKQAWAEMLTAKGIKR